jgi:hypothetical protein
MNFSKFKINEKVPLIKTATFLFFIKAIDVPYDKISNVLKNETSVTFQNIWMASLQFPHLWTDMINSLAYVYMFWVLSHLYNNLVDGKNFTPAYFSAINKFIYTLYFIVTVSVALTPIIEIYIRGEHLRFTSFITAEILALTGIAGVLKLISNRVNKLQNKVDSFV